MWKSAVEKFPPAYFTMVMATGIISLAAHAQHLSWLAEGFFYLYKPDLVIGHLVC